MAAAGVPSTRGEAAAVVSLTGADGIAAANQLDGWAVA